MGQNPVMPFPYSPQFFPIYEILMHFQWNGPRNEFILYKEMTKSEFLTEDSLL